MLDTKLDAKDTSMKDLDVTFKNVFWRAFDILLPDRVSLAKINS